MSKIGRSSFAIAGLALVISAYSQAQYYTPQVQPEHSVMFGLNWEAITDTSFDNMIDSTLLSGGHSNARAASFLFEQCFSGGMFNELDSSLNGQVSWVGGSAARHDESSWGSGDSAAYPIDYWTDALATSIAIGSIFNANVIDNVNGARNLDTAGPSYSGQEHPQTLYRNGGQNINLTDPGATAFHAVLWAGNANGIRHNNDIKLMYDVLTNEWAGRNYTITVLGDNASLGGIASDTATAAHLQAALNNVAGMMNSTSDFVFYASDHGGQENYFVLNPIQVLRGALDEHFAVSSAVLDGIRRTADGVPVLGLDFTGLNREGVHVFLDGVDLGDPYLQMLRTGSTDFNLSRDFFLRGGSDGYFVSIFNPGLDGLYLEDAFFGSGGIDNITADLVPEPTSILGLGVGLVILARRRRSIKR